MTRRPRKLEDRVTPSEVGTCDCPKLEARVKQNGDRGSWELELRSRKLDLPTSDFLADVGTCDFRKSEARAKQKSDHGSWKLR